MVTAEIKKIAQMKRFTRPQTFGELAEGVVAARRHSGLQGVDQRTGPDMAFATAAIFVKTTNRQGHDIAVKRLFVLGDGAALDALKTDTRNARRHAREEFSHERARQTDAFEVIATTIGANDRDAHFRHDLEQAGINRGLEALHDFSRAVHIREQATRITVKQAFLCEIGVNRGRTDTDQNGEVMHIHAFRRANVKRNVGTQRRLDEVAVNAAGRQDHRDCRTGFGNAFVGQDDVKGTTANGFFGFALNAGDRFAQRHLATIDIKGGVDFDCTVAHIAAHCVIFGVGQNRAFELQQIALAFILVEDVAKVAETGFQAHDARFTKTVDRRVGDLREVLTEEVMQATITVRQDRKRGVITHRANGFLAVLTHRMEDQLKVFMGQAHRLLQTQQTFFFEMSRLGTFR